MEQREVGAAFNEMTARVQRMVDAQRDFVADASHQLRTPLTGCGCAWRRPRRPARASRSTARWTRSTGSPSVVSELLVLSEAGTARAPDAVTDLLAGAARAVDRYPRALIELRGEPSLVRCTSADLDRMLDAVLENAIDYGPDGQIITVVAAPGRLTVTDQGPGLQPGEEETIFHRFHRGSVGRASRRRGTGLGPADRARARVALARLGDPGERIRRRRGRDDPAPARRRHHPERTAHHRGRHGMTGWRRSVGDRGRGRRGAVRGRGPDHGGLLVVGPERRALFRALDRGRRARAGRDRRRRHRPRGRPVRRRRARARA